MPLSKTRLLLLGFFVTTLAIGLGTLLWLNFAPKRVAGWNQLPGQQPLEGLNRHNVVPDFTLTERSGKPIALANLQGKVWIADFIYTTCTDTCPLQSAEMAKLQSELADVTNLRLVSFSVDPTKDTPAVLQAYAARFKADAERWLFLTGDKEQISNLVQGGFRLSAAPLKQDGTDTVILHSPRFVLVDSTATIRGYYDSREPDALLRLKQDLRALVKE
ncbi:MAG: SCO family protein [Deltaproteobacteria bacterium]|nr:SCO family protein [Deltaproteobacteria bacterium]MBM4298207.1 SCO family protein [Deltaproteobacteria bacterium]